MIKCLKCKCRRAEVKGIGTTDKTIAYAVCKCCKKDWWFDLFQYSPPKICETCCSYNTLYIGVTSECYYHKCAVCRTVWSLEIPKHIPEEQLERYLIAKV